MEADPKDDIRDPRSLDGKEQTAGLSPPPGGPTAPSTIANDSVWRRLVFL